MWCNSSLYRVLFLSIYRIDLSIAGIKHMFVLSNMHWSPQKGSTMGCILQKLVSCEDLWYDGLKVFFICSLPHWVDEEYHFLWDILSFTIAQVIQNQDREMLHQEVFNFIALRVSTLVVCFMWILLHNFWSESCPSINS